MTYKESSKKAFNCLCLHFSSNKLIIIDRKKQVKVPKLLLTYISTLVKKIQI